MKFISHSCYMVIVDGPHLCFISSSLWDQGDKVSQSEIWQGFMEEGRTRECFAKDSS